MSTLLRARLNEPTFIQLNQDGSLPTEILVLPVGKYDTYSGKIDITDSMLAEMVKNFDSGVPNGVPINFDHTYGKAAAWVSGLIHKAGEGLFAAVDWTKAGIQALEDKEYRYISAEFSTDYEDPTFGGEHGNVLSGAALTNYPMLQNIPALFSQHQDKTNPFTILFAQEGASMNLEDIRAKAAADLSAEEKAFLQEHFADLNEDERTKFGLEAEDAGDAGDDDAKDGEGEDDSDENAENADSDAGKAELAQKGGKTVQMSQAEVDSLKKMANAGAQAMTRLEKADAKEVAKSFTFSQGNPDGVFLAKSTDKLADFIFGLSADQKKAFGALMADMPKGLHQLTQETGHGQNLSTSADDKLTQLAQAKVAEAAKAGQTLEFSQALDQVLADNSELVADEYGFGGTK